MKLGICLLLLFVFLTQCLSTDVTVDGTYSPSPFVVNSGTLNISGKNNNRAYDILAAGSSSVFIAATNSIVTIQNVSLRPTTGNYVTITLSNTTLYLNNMTMENVAILRNFITCDYTSTIYFTDSYFSKVSSLQYSLVNGACTVYINGSTFSSVYASGGSNPRGPIVYFFTPNSFFNPTVYVEKSTFFNCSATTEAGCFFGVANATFILTDSSFSNCSAGQGGVISTNAANTNDVAVVSITRCQFSNLKTGTTASNSGGLIRGGGNGKTKLTILDSAVDNLTSPFGSFISFYSFEFEALIDNVTIAGNAPTTEGTILARATARQSRITLNNVKSYGNTGRGHFISITSQTDVTITNSEIRDNTGDGAIYTSSTSPFGISLTIENSKFLRNIGSEAATGAVINIKATLGAISIKNSTFSDNVSGLDYSVANFEKMINSSILFEGNTVSGNSATRNGAVGIYAPSSVNGTFRNNYFFGNSAGVEGGALNLYSFNSASASQGILNFSGNTFKSNTAKSGGAFVMKKNSFELYVNKNTFENNVATEGGAIAFIEITGANPMYFTDNTFTGNSAAHGSVFRASASTFEVTFDNCTFNNNYASLSGVISTFNDIDGNIIVTNSVFDSNYSPFTGLLTPSASCIGLDKVKYLSLENLNFKNNSATTTIAVLSSVGISVNNINVKENTGIVFYLDYSPQLTLSDSLFTSNKGSLLSNKNTQGLVTIANIIASNFTIPLATVSENYLFFVDNFIGDISIADIIVQDSDISDCAFFVDIDGSFVIDNFESRNNKGCTLYLQGSTSMTVQNSAIQGTVQSPFSQDSVITTTQNSKLTLESMTITSINFPQLISASGLELNMDELILTDCTFEVGILINSGEMIGNNLVFENIEATVESIISASGSSHSTIQQTQFKNLVTFIGAISTSDSAEMKIYSSTFLNNKGRSAFIDIEDDSSVEIRETSFTDGYSSTKAAIHITRGKGYLYNCSFENNYSKNGPSALSVVDEGDLQVYNTFVTNGYSTKDGPCLEIDSATFIFENGHFLNCSTPTNGGAVTISGESTCNFKGVTFKNNNALKEGAVLSISNIISSLITFESCTFEGNSATNGGVLIADYGIDNEVTFENCVFTHNEATGFGGLFYSSDSSKTYFKKCEFYSHSAQLGGIGYVDWESSSIFTDCLIDESYASDYAGSFYLDKSSSLELTATTIKNSLTKGSGGVVYLSSKSSLLATNSTFLDNSAGESGGAIFSPSGSICTGHLENCIAIGNKANIEEGKGGFMSFDLGSPGSLVINNFECNNNSASLGGCLNFDDLDYEPIVENAVFSNNKATIYGNSIKLPPSKLISSQLSFSLKTGEALPSFVISLTDEEGQVYTLPLSQELVITIDKALTYSDDDLSLSGTLQKTNSNGISSFSFDLSSQIKVYGNAGTYTLIAGPRKSDLVYSRSKFNVTLTIIILPCEGNYLVENRICKLIECSECSLNGVCVTPGNCSCSQNWEGLRCDLKKDQYGSIDFIFKELPNVSTKKRSENELITVAKRNYIIAETQKAVGENIQVEYRALFQNNEGYFVFRVSLIKDGNYLEGEALDKQRQIIQEYFGESLQVLNSESKEAIAAVMNPSNPIAVAVYIISFIMIGVAISLIAIVFKYRESAIIRAASPLFCYLILFGFILGYLTFLPYLGTQNKASCAVQPIFNPLAFSVVFSNLFIKTFRIYAIFANRKMRVVAPTNKQLLMYSAILIGIDLLLGIIWVIIDAPVPTIVGTGDNRFWTCESENKVVGKTMMSLLYIYNGGLLLFGIFLAIQTRKAFSAFRESQMIGFSIYIISVVAASFLPVIYLPLTIEIQFALRSFAVIFVTTATMLLLFLPKLFIIFIDSEKNRSDLYQDSSFQGFKMERGKNTSLTLGHQIDESGNLSGWLLVKKKGLVLSKWERKFAVKNGGYFGFFEKEEGGRGGLRPLHECQISKEDENADAFFFFDGLDGYEIDSPNLEDLKKWYQVLATNRV